jgi:hypothetical protein
MAILQAARAKELGLSLTQAKSWGLNRAIFYAAAKRGFKKPPHRHSPPTTGKPVEKSRDHWFLGNEMAYSVKKGNRTYFTFGGQVQTNGDFKQQIERRLGDAYTQAWNESLRIVREYPKEVLLSQNRFFEDVYRPRRDDLALKWSEMSAANR